ncbi:MAG TPA: hypothetical protein VK191_10030 [Symbiobacteriaceae bacterium]|nr:hypothetical protein [Symbiobacteriaceae bacterium]
MDLLRASFDEVKDEIRPGDLFAFGGYDADSRLIQLVGRAPISHTALAWQTGPDGPVLMEAVGVGVRRAPIKSRVEGYNGDVWWIPMSEEARTYLDLPALQQFLAEQEGKEFDVTQMLPAAIDLLDGGATKAREDLTRLFCSELVTGGLRAGGVLNLNPSETTPRDLVRQGIWAPYYVQLKGRTPRRIPGIGLLKEKKESKL